MTFLNIILALIAIVLSLPACVLAFIQNRDARRTLALSENSQKYISALKTELDGVLCTIQETESSLELVQSAIAKTEAGLDVAVTSLKDVLMQLPTRFVGKFPYNVHEIAALLRQAQSQITILSDFAGYASYSKPEVYKQYKEAVEKALEQQKDLKVNIYIYDYALRAATIDIAFTEEDFAEILADPKKKQTFESFKTRMARRGLTITNRKSFVEALNKDEYKCLSDFHEMPRVDCFELHQKAAFFLWMIDDKECVFSFENEPEKKTYFSFWTRDARLLEYFQLYIKASVKGSTPFLPLPAGSHEGV